MIAQGWEFSLKKTKNVHPKHLRHDPRAMSRPVNLRTAYLSSTVVSILSLSGLLLHLSMITNTLGMCFSRQLLDTFHAAERFPRHTRTMQRRDKPRAFSSCTIPKSPAIYLRPTGQCLKPGVLVSLTDTSQFLGSACRSTWHVLYFLSCESRFNSATFKQTLNDIVSRRSASATCWKHHQKHHQLPSATCHFPNSTKRQA